MLSAASLFDLAPRGRVEYVSQQLLLSIVLPHGAVLRADGSWAPLEGDDETPVLAFQSMVKARRMARRFRCACVATVFGLDQCEEVA